MRGKGKKHKSRRKPVSLHPRSNSPLPLSAHRGEPDLVVFVSSRIDRLREERDAVVRAIRSIHLTRDWAFEYTPASSQTVEESYLSKVRDCDIFVLLLGSEYSQVVVREHEVATEEGKPILAFVSTGTRSTEQDQLIRSLTTKYASYAKPDDLEQLVYASVLDEIIRRFKTTLRPSDAPKLIENLPVTVRRLEDISGYVIIGLEEADVGKILFEPFGGATPPDDLNELNPSMEPVYFDDFAEMNEVILAITNATTRTRAAKGDQQKAFLRELKREASEVASRFIIRQRGKQPKPQITVPGLKYFIWGMAPDIARMIRVMRPQEIIDRPKPVERTKNEYFFTDANYLVKVFAEIHEAGQKAAGDDEEFLRLLLAGAMRLHFLGIGDDDPVVPQN